MAQSAGSQDTSYPFRTAQPARSRRGLRPRKGSKLEQSGQERSNLENLGSSTRQKHNPHLPTEFPYAEALGSRNPSKRVQNLVSPEKACSPIGSPVSVASVSSKLHSENGSQSHQETALGTEESSRRIHKHVADGKKAAQVAGKLIGRIPGTSSVRLKRLGVSEDVSDCCLISGTSATDDGKVDQCDIVRTTGYPLPSSRRIRRKSYPLLKTASPVQRAQIDKGGGHEIQPISINAASSEAVTTIGGQPSSDAASCNDAGSSSSNLREEKQEKLLRFGAKSTSRTPTSNSNDFKSIISPLKRASHFKSNHFKASEASVSTIEIEKWGDDISRDEKPDKALRFNNKGTNWNVGSPNDLKKNMISPRKKQLKTSEALFEKVPISEEARGSPDLSHINSEGQTGKSANKARGVNKRQRKRSRRKIETRAPELFSTTTEEFLEDERHDNDVSPSGASNILVDTSHDESTWLTHQVKLLEIRLKETENELQQLMESSAENERLFHSEVQRLRQILGTVDQAQQLRYDSLLDVFTDNFRAMGTVEAQFEQLMGARQRQMQASGRGRMLYVFWLLVDFAVKALFQILQVASRSYKYLKERKRGAHIASNSNRKPKESTASS